MTTLTDPEYPKQPEAYYGARSILLRDVCTVVRGCALDPRPSQKAYNHSTDGFAWGYGGSGPAQLALAILLDMGLEKDAALRLHQDFKSDIIAGLPEHFTLPISEVRKWISLHKKGG
jgi:hypothetical protein